jgi:hypothetical protein
LLKKILIFHLLFLSSVLLYQNCGAPLHNEATTSISFFSGSCEATLMNAFGSSYYKTFKAKCASCHSNGPGIGAFANPDFQTAFNAFNSMGRLRVERNFVNPAHQSGITGPENQSLIDRYSSIWTTAEESFTKCAQNSGQDVIPGLEMLTLHKSNATMVRNARSGNPWVKFEWDLENEMANSADRGKYLMIFSIEMHVAVMNGNLRGYEFRNPTVRLKPNATTPYRINKILFSINQNKLYDVTTFSQMSALIVSMSDFNIAPNSGVALAVHSPVLATDGFAIAFGKLQPESGTIGGGDTSGGSTTGTMEPPLPTSVTHTQLLSTNVDLNVFNRACTRCHSGNAPPAGLDLTNYTQARTAVAEIVNRMNDSNNPMPPSGMLSERDRDMVRIWQTGGAPQ